VDEFYIVQNYYIIMDWAKKRAEMEVKSSFSGSFLDVFSFQFRFDD
jgi:hypothetical protein